MKGLAVTGTRLALGLPLCLLLGLSLRAQSVWSPGRTDTDQRIPGLEALAFVSLDDRSALVASGIGIYRVSSDSIPNPDSLAARLTNSLMPANAEWPGAFVRTASDTLFVSNDYAVLRSVDSGRSWHPFTALHGINSRRSLHVGGLLLADIGDRSIVRVDSEGMILDTIVMHHDVLPQYRSTDGRFYGLSDRALYRWNLDDISVEQAWLLELPGPVDYFTLFDESWMIADVRGEGMLVTTDSGATWRQAGTSRLDTVVRVVDGSLLAIRRLDRSRPLGYTELVRSTDSGRSWSVCRRLPVGGGAWLDRSGHVWSAEGAVLVRSTACGSGNADTIRGFHNAHVLDVGDFSSGYVASIDRPGLAENYDAPGYELYSSWDGDRWVSIDQGEGAFLGVDRNGRIYVVRHHLRVDSIDGQWSYLSSSYVRMSIDRGKTWETVDVTCHDQREGAVGYRFFHDDFDNVVFERYVYDPFDSTVPVEESAAFFVLRRGEREFEHLPEWSDDTEDDVVRLRLSAGRLQFHVEEPFQGERSVDERSITVLDQNLEIDYRIGVDQPRDHIRVGSDGGAFSWSEGSIGLFRSLDSGTVWLPVRRDGEHLHVLDFKEVEMLGWPRKGWVVSTDEGHLHSDNHGRTWQVIDRPSLTGDSVELTAGTQCPLFLTGWSFMLDTVEFSRPDPYRGHRLDQIDSIPVFSNTALAWGTPWHPWEFEIVGRGLEGCDVTVMLRNRFRRGQYDDDYVVGTRNRGLYHSWGFAQLGVDDAGSALPIFLDLR